MSKMTAEHVEECRAHAATGSATLVDQDFLIALCDLAKLALTPPQDVAEIVEELRECSLEKQQVGWGRPDGGQDYHISAILADKAADALLSQAARIRGLEGENGELREALKPFAAALDPNFRNHPDSYAPRPAKGKPNLGDFRRAANCLIRRAANLQGNGDE